jgi:hypothetical protein
MIPLVEFAYNNLDYIDKTRIGVMGHSNGGRNAWATSIYYGKRYHEALEAAMRAGSDGGAAITREEQNHIDNQNKIYSALIEGVSSFAGSFQYEHTNMGFIYGAYEESGYRKKNGSPLMGGGIPESLDMINSGLPEGQKLTTMELNKFYGDRASRTIRIVYNPPVTHPWIHFSSRATGQLIEYYQKVYDTGTSLPPGNQIWNVKEFFNLLGLIGIFMLVVPMAHALLSTNLFAGLKKTIPEELPALDTPFRKNLFWGGWLLGSVLSVIFASLMTRVYNNLAPPNMPTHIFGQNATNFIVLWAVCNGVWGLIWFFIIHKKFNIPAGITIDRLGLKITPKDFFKTLLLAVTMMGILYGIVALARWLFFTDFRIWITAFKTFPAFRFKLLAGYLPFFFIFFFSNSLIINSQMRVKGMDEKFNIFICALNNILGAIILFIIQYGKLLFTRVPLWGAEWIPFLNLFLTGPQVFVSGYFSRYLFKKTGTVWLPALFNTLFVVMLGVLNSVDMTIIG